MGAQTTAIEIRVEQKYVLVPPSAGTAASEIWDTPTGLRLDDGGCDGDSDANLQLYNFHKGAEPEGQPLYD